MTFFDLPGHGSASLVNRFSDDAVVLADSTTKELSTGLGAILTLIIGIYNMVINYKTFYSPLIKYSNPFFF